MFPCGHSRFNDLSTAKGLAGGTLTAIPAGVGQVLVQAEGAAVRWRDDGTDPVAGAGGLLIADGDVLIYDGSPAAFRMVADAAGAKANVAFYRPGRQGLLSESTSVEEVP